MTDPDDPTRAWQPGDETNPGTPAVPDADSTQAWRPVPDTPHAFVPPPVPPDATQVSPQVGPIPYEQPAYTPPTEGPPPRSNGPMIAVVVLLALILGVGIALLVTTLNNKDDSPATTIPTTTTTSTTTTSTTTTTTTTPTTTTTAPTTTAPTTTAPTSTASTTSTTSTTPGAPPPP